MMGRNRMTDVSFPSCHFCPHSLFYVQEIPTIRHKAAVNNSKKKTIAESERDRESERERERVCEKKASI